MKINIDELKIKVIIILILNIISCLLIYYFVAIFKTAIFIVYFLYIPSILACLWWKKIGLIVPCFLTVILVIFNLIINFNINPEIFNNFLRGFSLIIVGVVVALLSERVSAKEHEFNLIMEDLTRSNEDLQQFAYVASHDLQEPLRAIVSFSQLLEERYQEKLDKDGREFIHFITEGAIKMNILIKDLLAYSRITTHAKPSKLTDLEIILKDALFNLQESIKESGAVITYDKLPILKVDKTQFMQLFQNLISNAIKFRRKTPKIHIGAVQIENEWIFSIKDNGIGIESKYFGHLFNIFYRLHTKEEYPGTGIGLPICKKIVQRYGGKIWLESKLGVGSTFYFSIPLKKAKDSNFFRE